MGPKLGPVPILLSLAYVGTGYIAWVLARLILGNPAASLTGSRVLFVPLVASLIMVAWDLSQDPVWSTVLHAWVWVKGGNYFGVPLSNFFGWYVTAFVFYQLFAVYLRGRALNASALNSAYWQAPVLFYVVSAAGNLLLLGARPEPVMVADPAGRLWNVNDITGAGAMVSIFVMGTFALMAWFRLADTQSANRIIQRLERVNE